MNADGKLEVVVTFQVNAGIAQSLRENRGELLLKLPRHLLAKLDLKEGQVLLMTLKTLSRDDVEPVEAENTVGEDEGQDVKGGSSWVH